MKTKNVWRLANRPTSEDVVKLLNSGIITKDEAKEILFNVEEEGERDKKSLESEIKFLRELVEKLSNGNQTKIIETIRTVEVPYTRYPWYQPYTSWCSPHTNTAYYSVGTATGGTSSLSASNSLVGTVTSTSGSIYAANSGGKFSEIKTF